MEKRTTIDQIEVTRTGVLQIRIAKEVVDDDGSTISRQWHRTALSPGNDVVAQMRIVNSHLTTGLGFPAVSADEINRLNAVAEAAWTAAVVAAYQASSAASLPQTTD